MFHVKQLELLKIMESIVSIEGVSFGYHGSLALDEVSFHVGSGEVVGLLGPNGAGKTTSVRLLNGLLKPDQGSIRVMGLDPVEHGDQIRKQSGVLTEIAALYERLTAWQNLMFFGGLHGLSDSQIRERGTELLHFFDLADRADERVDSYSKGMRQRLALVRVLLHQPPLLYLDEPTSGLDPEASKKVIDLMLEFRQRDHRSMLICTHNLTVAEKLCDRLLIMRKGHILADGSLDALRAHFGLGLQVDIRLQNLLTAPMVAAVSQHAGVTQAVQGDAHTLQLDVTEEAVIPSLLETLMAQKALIVSVVPMEKSLEDVYLALQEEE